MREVAARPEGIAPPALGLEVLDRTADDSNLLQVQQVSKSDLGRASPGVAPNSRSFGAIVVQAEGVGSGAPRAVGPFFTVREVAARLCVSAATIYDVCNSGRLAHVRVNNAIRMGEDDLGGFLRNSRKEVTHASRKKKR